MIITITDLFTRLKLPSHHALTIESKRIKDQTILYYYLHSNIIENKISLSTTKKKKIKSN